MDLSWELEQTGLVAAPDTVLDGQRLLHRVSDLVHHEDGSIDALVRTEVPHAVSLPGKHWWDGSSCSCGSSRRLSPCAHAIATRLRHLQQSHGLDDERLARWERWIESLRMLHSAWDSLADDWLEARSHGEAGATWTALRAVGSLHGALQMARALDKRATGEQLSAFLRDLASWYGIDGTTPLSPSAISDARELADFAMAPLDVHGPAAMTDLLLAVAGSTRLTATTPDADWRIDGVFRSACSVLGQLVATGNTDASEVADVLLRAEFDAPATSHPWSAFMLLYLGDGAYQVAEEMGSLLRDREPSGGWVMASDPRFRLRAEIGFVCGGVEGLLPVLEEWPEAPYGEFLRRLPHSFAPTARVALLESARRSGRAGWAPGWWTRSKTFSRRSLHDLHKSSQRESIRGTIAIGDLIVTEARLGREGRARKILREHALRDCNPVHRYEFLRIWEAATLGAGAEASATEIFGHAAEDEDLAEVLAAISRLPDAYFERDPIRDEDGLGTVLLTAVLLEDIPPEGEARQLDASTWVESMFSWYPAAADDLEALASLPLDGVGEALEGAVLDRHLALRARRIAAQLIESGLPVRSMADLRHHGVELFLDALEQVADATAFTAALFALLLGDPCHVAFESVRSSFLRTALTARPPHDGAALIDLAHSIEPRCADLREYHLAVVLAERDGAVSAPRRRR